MPFNEIKMYCVLFTYSKIAYVNLEKMCPQNFEKIVLFQVLGPSE